MAAFDLMFSPDPFSSKPPGAAVGAQRRKMRRTRCTPRGFAKLVQSGHAWTPGILEGGFDRGHWLRQQLIGLDFDNSVIDRGEKRALMPGEDGFITSREAIDRLLDAGVTPMCAYESYSSSTSNRRFRIVVCLSEPCEDPDVMESAIARLLHLFPEADRKCSDLARLFFGTSADKGVVDFASLSRRYRDCDIRTVLALPAPDDVVGNRGLESRRHESQPTISLHNHIELDALKREADLANLIKLDTGEGGRRSGKTLLFHHCPVCGHRDCFAFYPDTNSWACFSTSNATGKAGGSAIDYAMATRGLSFIEALAWLASQHHPENPNGRK